jgi:hypothetical protein
MDSKPDSTDPRICLRKILARPECTILSTLHGQYINRPAFRMGVDRAFYSEVNHWTGHPTRLNRHEGMRARNGSAAYAMEELRRGVEQQPSLAFRRTFTACQSHRGLPETAEGRQTGESSGQQQMLRTSAFACSLQYAPSSATTQRHSAHIACTDYSDDESWTSISVRCLSSASSSGLS